MNLIKIYLALILLYTCSLSHAQDSLKEATGQEFLLLEKQYNDGRLTPRQYLNKADSLLLALFSSGITFEKKELSRYMELFRTIAWSKAQYKPYRSTYFRHLMNNADLSGKGGEALFYAEKYSQEFKKEGKKDLAELYLRCSFYTLNSVPQKAIRLYEQELPYLSQLYKKNKPADYDVNEDMQAIQIFLNMINAYLQTENVTKAKEAQIHAIRLDSALSASPNIRPGPKAGASSMVNFIGVEISLYEKQYPDVKERLNHIHHTITENKEALSGIYSFFEANMVEWWLRYYLAVGNNDSAEVYLSRMEQQPRLFSDYDPHLARYRSKLAANKGQFNEAYNILSNSITAFDKEYALLANEMDELLYAHTESEFHKSELEEAEKVKREQLAWIILIGSCTIIIVLGATWLLLREKRNADSRLRSLNKMADIQVEEARRQASREAHGQLGQDLHDDLSSSLAGSLHHLQRLVLQTTEQEVKDGLELIHHRTSSIYESVRNKSHTLFSRAADTHQDHFDESIRKIVDSALPDKDFRKEIDIDKSTAMHLNLGQRIEILRIIQEAVTNIIQHARRANEVFVFLFEENNNIILQIGDNGRELNLKNDNKKDGLGLKSIRNRAEAMNGRLKIETEEGMVLTIYIPNSRKVLY